LLVLVLAGCANDPPTPADFLGASPAPAVLTNLPSQVLEFIEQKERFALMLAVRLGVKPDRATLRYFAHARKGEYRAASLIYQDLRERGGRVESPKYDPDLLLPLWDPLLEVQLTLDAYAEGAGKFATAFGEDIVSSIPPGSIYFGGTDPGRALPAAFSKSSSDGDPIFVLTQNQLADGQHINYLRAAFGGKIQVLSHEDSQQAYRDYLDDAKRRYEHDKAFPTEPPQLRRYETVTMQDGRPSVSGEAAVIALNGLLAKTLFDNNRNCEFYIEESFAIDWMYPHLTPHGLIMKINRQPLSELPAEVVNRDREFWHRQQVGFIGDWLKPETSVREVCDFAERIFLRKDLSGFRGDRDFVRNHYATATYSKLRCAQAVVFTWRVANAKSTEERQQMIEVADFAFRQSFAFSPVNVEAVFRYVNLLLQIDRADDSIQIASTAARLAPSEKQFASLILELERIKESATK